MLTPETIENRTVSIKFRALHKCKKCHIETRQEDGICILCKSGITKMYKELIRSLKKDKQHDLLLKLQMIEENHRLPSYEQEVNIRYDSPYTAVEYFIDSGIKYKSFKPKKLDIGFITNVNKSGVHLFAYKKLKQGQRIIIKNNSSTSFHRTVARWTEKFDDVFYKTRLDFI